LQFFYNYITSEEADNVPDCPACVYGEADTWSRIEEVLDRPEDFFDTDLPIAGVDKVRTA
jgi:hypothetical protein